MTLGVLLGNQDAVWPALFLILLPVAALVATLAFRPSFTLDRETTPGVVAAGEPATVALTIRTRRPSRAGTVAAEDDPGQALGTPHRVHLAASRVGQASRSTYPVQPRRRGRYTLDGFRYRFVDLLGFWVHTVRVAHPTPLVVTPAVTPLPPTSAHAYGATGETPIPQPAVRGPDDAMVREYQPRDDVRRIHWPSTARAGTLMVRREEAAWDPTAWVLLDSRAGVHPLVRGEYPSFEWLVSAAASIGLRLLADGFTVTLVDADLTGASDLHEATTRMAQAGSEHLLVALLGGLDLGSADLLAATTGSRQQRIAVVAIPDAAARSGFEAGRAVLVDHGWEVREASTGEELARLWAERVVGARR
ncbi:MAG: DUF58 domain-containing protein [Actinomycetes bacterium]